MVTVDDIYSVIFLLEIHIFIEKLLVNVLIQIFPLISYIAFTYSLFWTHHTLLCYTNSKHNYLKICWGLLSREANYLFFYFLLLKMECYYFNDILLAAISMQHCDLILAYLTASFKELFMPYKWGITIV